MKLSVGGIRAMSKVDGLIRRLRVSWKPALSTVLLPIKKARGRPPLDESSILDSDARKRILRMVAERPGRRVSDLHRDSGMSAGRFYHHLSKLEEAQLIIRQVHGGISRAYPPGQSGTPPVATPLDNATARAVAHMLLRKPGVTSDEIAARLGFSRRTVQIRLKHLVEAELAETERRGWKTHYHPAPELGDVLEKADR